MGKVKQIFIDQARVYVRNGHSLDREDFIERVLKDLYLNTDRNDMREQLDCLLNDNNLEELLCIGDNKYMSYIAGDIDGDAVNYVELVGEERPLKSYEVSYDVVVQPLIPFVSRKRVYKRVTEAIAATSFKEAKELVRKRTHAEGKTTKSYEVVEVKLTEGVSVSE